MLQQDQETLLPTLNDYLENLRAEDLSFDMNAIKKVKLSLLVMTELYDLLSDLSLNSDNMSEIILILSL